MRLFRVLGLVAAACLFAAPAAAGYGGGGGGGGGGCTNSGCTTPFAVALPIPSVLTPTSTDATTDYYTITEVQANASIIPGHTTPVWTYNGVYPGPTIETTRGRIVKVHVVNDLPESTTVHLHGAHVAASSDGGPNATFPPGASFDYTYTNDQSARTLWYHDHALDLTGAHVYKGLAGFYLITDSQEQSLNLPSGSNDIPLVLQDRKFNTDGTLSYTVDSSTIRTGFTGDVQLVNGAPQPYLQVGTRKVRFRVLNGSNARYYQLQLSNGQSLTEIGNESGLFSAPITMRSITVAPAERADFVIDFSTVPAGTSVTLQNGRYDSIGDLLRFDVSAATDTSTVPATLRTFTPIPASQATVSRTFRISQDNGVWVFNGLPYDPARIDAQVALNATEIWTFDNRSGRDHPIHVHDINFQVLSVDGKAPPPDEAQWKETVNVPGWKTVQVIAQYTDFTGGYVFHCHILEHEDHSLMANFNVG